jgi:hypothetical protein
MNPEFRRLAGVDFQRHRLAALTVALIGTFGVGYLADDRGFGTTTAFFAIVGYFAAVFFWGTRQAAECVTSEINAQTWDAQRMSSLSAWSLAWSKFAGATAFTWVGGAVCLAFYAVAHIGDLGPRQTLLRVFIYIVSGFFGQAVCFLIGLSAIQRRRQFGRVQVASYQVVGLLAALPPLYVGLAGTSGESILDLIIWYGRYVTFAQFMIATMAVFSLWTLAGAWALMRAELQEPVGPWAWIAFALFAMAYFAGIKNFPVGPSLQLAKISLPTMPTLTLGVGLAIAFTAAYMEPKDRLRLAQIERDLAIGRWRAAAVLFPRSVIALALAALGAIVALVIDGAPLQQLPGLAASLAAMALFAVRDIAFIYWLCLGRIDGRGVGLAATVLVVGYVPLPMLLGVIGFGPLLAAFLPVPDAPPWLTVALPALEAALMLWLLGRRWRRLSGAMGGTAA